MILTENHTRMRRMAGGTRLLGPRSWILILVSLQCVCDSEEQDFSVTRIKNCRTGVTENWYRFDKKQLTLVAVTLTLTKASSAAECVALCFSSPSCQMISYQHGTTCYLGEFKKVVVASDLGDEPGGILVLRGMHVGWFWSLVTCDVGPFVNVETGGTTRDFIGDATHGLLSGMDIGTYGDTQPQAVRLRLHFGSHTTRWIGYDSPQSVHSFTLKPGEVITMVTLHHGNLRSTIPNAGSYPMISAFTFTTNLGTTYGPYGDTTHVALTESTVSGKQLVSLRIHHGWLLHNTFLKFIGCD